MSIALTIVLCVVACAVGSGAGIGVFIAVKNKKAKSANDKAEKIKKTVDKSPFLIYNVKQERLYFLKGELL